MKIAILGAGFTGLAAGYRLLQKGHQVTIFEKEDSLGGLAVGFSSPNWQWTLERGYHHWFTNDNYSLNLAKEINHQVIIKRPSTDVFIKGNRLPFDSILALLKFPHLSLTDRLRLGVTLLLLKTLPSHQFLEGKIALPWIRKIMGDKTTNLIWEPLFSGKFGKFKDIIALTWFWARIKKRTPSLAYPEGGFKAFTDHLGLEIKKLGGKILLNTPVKSLQNTNKYCVVETDKKKYQFDKVLVTLPSPIFVKIADGLPKGYVERITSIDHLHAQVLILVLKKSFMEKTYWLNITDRSFPFLVLAEHTNFIPTKYYGDQHILYVGNYLPSNHPYLKMDKALLLKKFLPYLKKLNSKFLILNSELFIGPFAQPIVTVDYPNLKPDFKTPLKNVYLANLDMVYPWDRGTNYAVQLGEKVAKLIIR